MISRRAVLAGLLSLPLTACGGPSSSSVVAIDGSSTVFPVAEAVAEEFQRVNREARVTVGTSGTGGGFQKFCRGETDLSNASRPIRPQEVETCRAAGIEFIELPVAYDGLSVVVHPANTWASSMTVGELKRLWQPEAQGRVTRWSQVRADWPDREIHLYGAGTDSGTFDYFTEAVMGKTDASRGDYTGSEDDHVLVQGVAGDPLALGYFGYAYYDENREQLRLVAIDDEDASNGAGPIAPSPETVRNGTYAPLSRPLFIYVSVPKLARPEVTAFVDFLIGEGAALVTEVGYVQLAPAEQALVRERWSSRATGTMFGANAGGTTLEQALRGGKQ